MYVDMRMLYYGTRSRRNLQLHLSHCKVAKSFVALCQENGVRYLYPLSSTKPLLLLIHFQSMKRVFFVFVSLGIHLCSALQQPSQHGMCRTRRSFVTSGVLLPAVVAFVPSPAAQAAPSLLLSELLGQIQQAELQLQKVPALISNEKWDAVRAVLIEPPLADCWAKTSRPLVTRYAEELGNSGGDELAALEAREELQGHLRFLDMSVYNNVFNPITVEGKSGATKELVRSYYEDPVNEFKASLAALQTLIELSTQT